MVTATLATIRLDIGEPDFDTPPHIVEAAARALRDGATRYVAPEGLPRLRAAIASTLHARGCAASPDHVVIGAGAKPVLCTALRALLRDGDEALVPDPGYPGYRAAVSYAGGSPVPYPVVDSDGRFRVDAAAIEARITPRTRVLVLNTPHNPTGGVCSDAELDALAELAVRHDLHVVSDEVYGAIVFDGGNVTTIAARPGMRDRTVLVDSFSKTYAMTGWRLGYAVVPPHLMEPMRGMILNTATCTPAFVQEAGIAALTGPQHAVQAMVRTYAERRELMMAALRGIPGLSVQRPSGAFYTFPRLAAPIAGISARMTARLREKHGLACASGAAYGALGEGHVRLSFAASEDELREGVVRLARLAVTTWEA